MSLLTEFTTNPRRLFEETSLKELADTIRTNGVLSTVRQNVVIRSPRKLSKISTMEINFHSGGANRYSCGFWRSKISTTIVSS
jgi:hypothetical protein